MLLQISSGQGPVECEIAVFKFSKWVCENFNAEIVKLTEGNLKDTYKSCVIACQEDLSFLDGSIKWICKSPIRPEHKRKNWFIDVSIYNANTKISFDENAVRYETFRSGGKGGQNVNKVETGVRAIYLKNGMSAVSTSERSQLINKKIAISRLKELMAYENEIIENKNKQNNWLEMKHLKRGSEGYVFEGEEFILKRK